MDQAKDLLRLINKIEIVGSEEACHGLLNRLVHCESPQVLSFLNAHGFNLSRDNPEFMDFMLRSDFLLRDGAGLQIAFRILGRHPGLNMNGTDLIPKILIRGQALRIAVFGTREPNLSLALKEIESLGHEVLVGRDGFLSAESYLADFLGFKPSLVLLGMGMPKQEGISLLLRDAADWPCLIINGGAILDFMSGRIRRAPRVLRRMGMEWLWRLFLEPRRLWRRYLLGNLRFLWTCFCLLRHKAD